MTHTTTSQKTFGKATQILVRTLCPTAATKGPMGNDFVIRDKDGKCVATWHKQRNANGLIVIH